MELSDSNLELDVTSSGSLDTSPLRTATSNSERNSVTREDLDQAGKPSTRQEHTVHRPITRSQGRFRPRPDTPAFADRPSCTAHSDMMDELRIDEEIIIYQSKRASNTASNIQDTEQTLETASDSYC